MFTRDKCIEEERTHEIIIITIKFQRSLNCVERRRSRTILNLEQALEQVDAIIKCLGEGGTREIYVENLVLEGSRYRNIRKHPPRTGQVARFSTERGVKRAEEGAACSPSLSVSRTHRLLRSEIMDNHRTYVTWRAGLSQRDGQRPLIDSPRA